MSSFFHDPRFAPLLDLVGRHPDGIGLAEIEKALPEAPGRRAIQYRLGVLLREGLVAKRGERRWALYHLPTNVGHAAMTLPEMEVRATMEQSPPLSKPATDVLRRLERPLSARPERCFRAEFLRDYEPNVTGWLSTEERARLRRLGDAVDEPQPAGTYARRIMDRFLIELSWNSSRLEGNTYSLLDTKRLIEFGEEAEDGNATEAQMILNHKEAIEFLVESVDDPDFGDRRLILNLHALLANNLLSDPTAHGRLRQCPVRIGGSTYRPADAPWLIESCFDETLERLSRIDDPFEQSLATLAQLPYLQPFDDVNKRVSRLAANLPLIRHNLVPISFVEVPRHLYVHALLGVYEFENVALLKDLFLWAYERSAARYALVRRSIGDPDPFRVRYRQALVSAIGAVVRERIPRERISQAVARWTEENVGESDRERFRELVETELLSLHEGNFARYRLRPSEFETWQAMWR